MGKKIVKFPSMFKKVSNDQWQWPSSCNNPTTFRAGYENNDDMMFKTVNSIFLDPCNCYIDETSLDKPSYTNSSEYHSSSLSNTTSTDQLEDQNTADDDQLEQIIRGVQSDRLFFEPCNSLLSSTTTTSAQVFENVGDSTHHDTRDENFEDLPFKESVVLAMESEDPYEDFKGSMMEMVESHGIKDWECLEELLEWYLKMNGKMNHGIIVQAFVDLLVGLASSDDSTSFSSAASTFSSSPTFSTTSRREFDHQDHM